MAKVNIIIKTLFLFSISFLLNVILVSAQDPLGTSKIDIVSVLRPILVLLIILSISIYSIINKRWTLLVGGIIGLIISIVDIFIGALISVYLFYPILYLLCNASCSGNEVFWTSIFGFVIIGYLIGWVIEKIKSKKQ